MKERPILFSAAMVRAILEGRKTQTRRVIKPQPKSHMTDPVNLDQVFPSKPWLFTGPNLGQDGKPLEWNDETIRKFGGWPDCSEQFACPYGQTGDRLWARETFLHYGNTWQGAFGCLLLTYAADNANGRIPWNGEPPTRDWWNTGKRPWTPSIHMPRWASRITLEITDVRIQRLQEISEEDAKAEGFEKQFRHVIANPHGRDYSIPNSYRGGFVNGWSEINGSESWDVNPWVWAITFKQVAA